MVLVGATSTDVKALATYNFSNNHLLPLSVRYTPSLTGYTEAVRAYHQESQCMLIGFEADFEPKTHKLYDSKVMTLKECADNYRLTEI
ncbi:unnamed protein product [Rotaria sp. Silwood1]|nr:unnamed protein product [Rotaria sp. Silwood1]